MGDDNNPNLYMTVYKKALNGRQCKTPAENQKKNFLKTFKINGNEENDFISEKQLR